MFFEQFEILNFYENTQNCFAYISATKYRSEAVLYSKRTAGYPLSPRIKTIAVAFLQARFQKIINKLTDWQTLTLSSTWDSWTITCLKMCLPNDWRNLYTMCTDMFEPCWRHVYTTFTPYLQTCLHHAWRHVYMISKLV